MTLRIASTQGEAANILERALTHLRTVGFYKGDFYENWASNFMISAGDEASPTNRENAMTAPVCSLGAICYGIRDYPTPWVALSLDHEFNKIYGKLVDYLGRYLSTEDEELSGNGGHVPHWNDLETTTYDDIVELFETAITDLRKHPHASF